MNQLIHERSGGALTEIFNNKFCIISKEERNTCIYFDRYKRDAFGAAYRI